jgi:hypothetical protein
VDRVLTKRGALVELAIVTAGVLIALSFDGARGWMRDRDLLEAARANLTRELQANKTAVERFRTTLDERQEELSAMRVAADGLRNGRAPTGELTLNFVFADVSSTAHATAQMTGAFGLMEYDEVNRYTSIYGRQTNFGRMQDETTSMLRNVLSKLWVIEAKQPPTETIDAWIDEISSLSSQIYLLDQFAGNLAAGYGRALAETEDVR